MANKAAQAVAADARMLQAHVLHMLEASLTGESEAVLKHSEPLAAPAALDDRRNMVFKDLAVAQGRGRALVKATGMDTEVGAIATMLDATQWVVCVAVPSRVLVLGEVRKVLRRG